MSQPPPADPRPPETDAPEVAPDPFEPGPASLPGCGKPAVIGCLVVLALLAVLMAVLVSQSSRLARLLLDQIRSDVVAALPEDLAEAERQRLDEAFDGATAALVEGRIDEKSMGRLQRLAKLLPAKDETLSREKVAQITELLEAMAAVPSPSSELAAPEAELVAI